MNEHKEYELLWQEIIGFQNAIVQYNSVLYATVAAILAYSIDKPNYFLCLIPYAILVPLYLLNEDCCQNMCANATYIYVFYESKTPEFQWERRHHAFEKTDRSRYNIIQWYLKRMMARAQYVLTVLLCAFLSTYKVIVSKSVWSNKCISLTLVWLLTIAVMTLLVIKVTDWTAFREECIQKWQAVKAAEEEAQKRDSNRNPQ